MQINQIIKRSLNNGMKNLLCLLLLQLLQPAIVIAASYNVGDGNLTKGVIFHETSKILVAEKFVNVQFLLPFPKFDAHIQSELKNITTTLQTMWDMDSLLCHLQYNNKTTDHFQVNWIVVSEVQKEIDAAEIELEQLQLEIQSLLPPPAQPIRQNRTARGAPIAAAALGAIGLFGGGVIMGSGSCGLTGIFGKCQSAKNSEEINKLFRYQEYIIDNMEHISHITDVKFRVVSKELKAIHDIQNQMAEIQNENWEVIQNQLETYRNEIHKMRNCDQLLFTRQQINFNFDTIASLLSLYYSSIKSYRAAFFAYRKNSMYITPSTKKESINLSRVSLQFFSLSANYPSFAFYCYFLGF